MKQLLENFKNGQCVVEEVPTPVARPGFLLVRNAYSVISTGTEGGTVKLGKMSLLGKARARPEQAMKVIQVARTQGVLTAYRAAMRSLEMPVVLGYCCAGRVIEVGEGVSGFSIGDLVACAGAGYANHAEVVCVPKNLCVQLPADLDPRLGAFATLGSIALQGVRVADSRLGDNVVVIGLGLVGLLVVQLLRAAGCRVFGIDVDEARRRFVEDRFGCDAALAGDANLAERVRAFSGGHGADAVIITAATADNKPVALAGALCRRKGRVVVVGRTEMTAPRETYLFKELELCTSMAYGPGTGDPSYELDGVDYPIGYVRWTENRNMAAFLDQVADGRVDVRCLITHQFDIDDAPRAFDLITGKTGERSTAVVLHYPPSADDEEAARRAPIALSPPRTAPQEGTLRIGVIGAGSYATNEFLPLLAKSTGVELRTITSATGVRAKALGGKYGFRQCAADARAVIEDAECDCVFILTRHDTHAALAAAALDAGKHVFVEKPLALTAEELAAVEAAQRRSGRLLMVGFNRRYAPLALGVREFIGRRAQPMSILYRANVGYRPPEHWLHDPKQGGGVIVGEACHHIDFCGWLVGSPVLRVEARTLDGASSGLIPADNAHITLSYADGSLATIAYLSNGSKAYNIERIELSCDNRLATITDYQEAELAQGMSVKRRRLRFGSDKGHAGQIAAFLAAARGEAQLDAASYIASSRVAIEAAMQVTGTRQGRPEDSR